MRLTKVEKDQKVKRSYIHHDRGIRFCHVDIKMNLIRQEIDTLISIMARVKVKDILNDHVYEVDIN